MADGGWGPGREWALLEGRAECWFAGPSHAAGARLISELARLDLPGPVPEFDLRRTGVNVRIQQQVPGLDPVLAGTISDLAGSAGLRSEPGSVQRFEIGIESPDPAAVIECWRLVCDYQRSGDDLVDALHRDPVLRFTASAETRPLRNRIHLDVDAGRAFTPDRVAKLKRVGGHIIRDAISADADGNEVCIPFRPPALLDDTAELADWRQLMGAVVRYPISSLAQAAELTAAVARIADDAGKPLIVDVRSGAVIIDSGKDQQEDENFGLDAGFRELARDVQASARNLGLVADPGAGLRHVQVAIDAVDIAAVQRFWLTALGYQADPRSFVTDIVDPRRRGPVVWFQQMEADDEARRLQRNRIRLRLAVPHDQVRPRLEAAVEAGGTIIDSTAGPVRWVVADLEGNELELVS